MRWVKNQTSRVRPASENRMAGFYRVSASVLFCLAFLASFTSYGQGSLTPSGAPGPTMRTLSQVEPRTPISSLPFTIAAPGAYYLTTNLTGVASSNGITVQANDATIDLHGFALVGVSGSLSGIAVPFARSGLTVFGGVIRGWGATGISAANASSAQYSSLSLLSNTGDGLDAGTNSIVRDCVATGNSGDGLALNSSCLVENNNCQANGACGIHVLGNACRVESNHMVTNGTSGLEVDGTQSLIVRNSAVNDVGTDYNIAANNDYGQIYTRAGAGFTGSNPWANFASPAASCTDGIKDGNETDVDCGGGTCSTCALGKNCLASSDCQSAYCSGGVCSTPLGGNGTTCTSAAQCLSGNCVGGICCNTACNGGPCMTCAGGTCGNSPVGFACSSPVCNGSVLTTADICNGNGSCVSGSPATINCAPYACANSSACATSCPSNSPSGDTSCATAYFCNGSACVSKLSSGATCSRNGQCASGTCNGSACL